jgi:long-chain acyl-CoA synthetase
LVTLNRYGANRLGSVGTALPNTRVRIAADGEVLIQGPQVTEGYFGELSEGLFKDGWLHTGDLGEMNIDGNLIILGRKKEILVTSYGKNIQPLKIEEMLRRIPGMAEVMVVGESKPEISALLWVQKGSWTPDAFKEIDHSVRRLNKRLSHPEQVKRWAVLADNPAIDNGELTGNLKLRRQVVLAQRERVVAMLYGRRNGRTQAALETPTPGVLHVGMCRDE